MQAHTPHHSSHTSLSRALVPLLAVAIFINYVDRGNLATAAPLIKDELRLTGTQIGLLVSAFFWSYVPSQLLAGWLAERINPYRTLALGLTVWSLATIASGFAAGFLTLMGLRLLLGLGESAAYPCIAKLFAQHLPADKLGGANGLIGVGMALGPALGTLVGGMLMARAGWREVFVLFGAMSLLWLVPWFVTARGASEPAADMQEGGVSTWTTISVRREIWGASLGQFCGNYAFYFVISWLPLYLVKARGLSLVHMSEISGVVYLVYAASALLTGRLADRRIRAGAGTNRVRKGNIITAHTLMAITMTVAALGSLEVSIVSLICSGVAFGFFTPNVYAIGQTLAGPRVAGPWIGIQNCFGNLSGIVAPLVTGIVIDLTGQYFWAFLIAAVVAATGILGWGVMIRRIEPLDWDDRRASNTLVAAEAN